MRLAVSALRDLVLGPTGRQRELVAQTLLGLVVYLAFALMQHAEVLLGLVDRAESNLLTSTYIGGSVFFYLALRSGLSRRFGGDPSLTLLQTGFAVVMACGSYAITGPARGGALTLMVLMMAFAMFTLQPRQARRLALFAFGSLIGVIAWKSHFDPTRYPLAVELIHAIWAAIVLCGVTVLAGRMGRMRSRLTEQRRQLREALEHISQLATSDELTGLVNRRHMAQLLTEQQVRQRGGRHAMTVALLDIDLFKRINDGHGHHAGDQVLRAFADSSRSVLRADDVLARWGGEEFLLMLPDTSPAQAEATVERLRQRLAQVSFEHIAAGMKVTFSAGLAACDDAAPIDACIERADQAMYRAKLLGRDCTVTAAA